MALISQAAYAKRKGVSPPYINKLVKQGKIPTVDGQIDPTKADAALENNRDPAHQGHRRDVPRATEPRVSAPREQSAGTLNFLQARTIREQIKAKLDKLEYDRRTGQVVAIADVEDALTQSFRNVRARLLNLPTKIAPRVVGCKNIAQVKSLLENEIHQTLTELVVVAGDLTIGGENVLDERLSHETPKPELKPRSS